MLFSAFCRTSLASLYCYNTALHRWITYCRMRMRINAIKVVIKPYKTVEQIKMPFGGRQTRFGPRNRVRWRDLANTMNRCATAAMRAVATLL